MTDCILWQGYIDPDGYGREHFNGRTQPAHRVAYKRKFGEFRGQLDHLCRVRACVNTDHLEPVTNAENVRRGTSAKINHEIASRIRYMYATGKYRQGEIGALFKIGQDTVSLIVNNKRWAKL